MWAARAQLRTASPIATQFPVHGCMDYLTNEHIFDSRATQWVVDVLDFFFFWNVIHPVRKDYVFKHKYKKGIIMAFQYINFGNLWTSCLLRSRNHEEYHQKRRRNQVKKKQTRIDYVWKIRKKEEIVWFLWENYAKPIPLCVVGTLPISFLFFHIFSISLQQSKRNRCIGHA